MMPRIEQEPDTVAQRLITYCALAVVVISAIGILIAAGLLRGAAGSLRPEQAPAAPAKKLGILEASQIGPFSPGPVNATVDAGRPYQWVDREAGLVRVPVEVAIDLYLARRGESVQSMDAGVSP